MHVYTRGNRVLAYAPINKVNRQPVNAETNCFIRKLSSNDVDEMVNLSSCVYKSLSKGQECFIHQHDRKYYEDMLNNSNIYFVVVFL